jgi:hypothetical protein
MIKNPTSQSLELYPVRLETKASAQLDSVSIDTHLEPQEFRCKMRKPIFAEHTDVSSDHESRSRPDLDPRLNPCCQRMVWELFLFG